MDTNGHYSITQDYYHIKNVYCLHCDFIVWRPRGGTPMGKYNKMRGAMVKHLHAEHRDKLTT
ncbi:hypothetical protein LCGC14_2582300 [marine sediment metagenome]|uniref:Uncharacterized protein n=1 Tax=marine sediment metagenome TaxID=412755 RepID=A0A0F9D6U8_9ZZZZ